MCEFVSFIILKDESLPNRKRILADYALNGHTAAADQYGIKNTDYVEAEWTNNLESSLVVRVGKKDHDEAWYKSLVLAEFPERQKLINWFTQKWGIKYNTGGIVAWGKKIKHVKGDLDLRRTPITSLGSLRSVGGDMDLWGTPITSLGSLKTVGGDLSLWGTPLTSLGSLRLVGGYLDLCGTPLTENDCNNIKYGRLYI